MINCRPVALIIISCLLLLCITFLQTALAEENEGSGTSADPFRIPMTNLNVNVDGTLDEACWNSALVVELNYEVSPRENVKPNVKTEALFTFDDKNLYIGFRCYDPEPSKIRAHLSDRDSFGNDDWVAVEMDTYNDSRRAFTLLVNPLGVQADGLSDAAGIKDYNWDMICDTAGRITDWGYTVEVAIPFSSLRFQRSLEEQVWGINIARGYSRDLRYQIWSGPYDRGNSCRVCQYLKFKGFKGVSPGKNIEITPTITTVQMENREDFPDGDFDSTDSNTDLGVTGRWGITPNLFLGGTFNPDFSQVEADALQLDINQPFALSYIEKRPFFTDGADFFRSPFNVIYTRTMRDPNLGFKLTGKEGANAVGAYVVQDDVTNLIFPGSESSQAVSLPESNLSSVFRYSRDIWNNSNVGVLLTNRQNDNYHNRIYGLDGTLRFTQSDTVSWQFLGSNTQYDTATAKRFKQPLDSFSDRALQLSYIHKTNHYQGELIYKEIGPDFRADLGFLPQVGYKSYGTRSIYEWRNTKDSWWSSFRLLNGLYYISDSENDLLEKGIYTSATFQGFRQTYLFLGNITSRQKYNLEEFELVQFDVTAGFQPTGNIDISVSGNFGDAIDFANTRPGKRARISPSLLLNLGLHLGLQFDHTYERLDVEEQRLYTANISQATLIYNFSTRMFFRSLFQYVDYDYNASNYTFAIDPEYRHLFTQMLFSYKLNPRTVLFLGYTNNSFGANDYGITQKDHTIFLKIGYAWVL